MPFVPPNSNAGYSNPTGYAALTTFQPNTASADGVPGYVPQPPAGTPATYVLRADGTWGQGGGGGGGGVPTITATWSTGGTAKDSTTTAGINLAISVATNQTVTVTSVTVGGVNCTGTFTVTGTFPSYSVAIPSGQVPAAIQTNGGAVLVQGLFNAVGYAAPAGTLTINPAVQFNVTTVANYLLAAYPYWITTDRVSFTGTVTAGTYTSQSLTITDTVSSESITTLIQTTTNSYRFVGPTTVSGSITGNGTGGQGARVVPVSITVTAPTIYNPVIYGYVGATVPTAVTPIPNGQFITAGFVAGQTFTAGVQATRVTYWLAIPTASAAGRTFRFTKLGGQPVVVTADLTGTQTIGTVAYSWFGFNNFDSTDGVVIVEID